MRVIDHIENAKKTIFSFEVLPPLKGNGIDRLFDNIDMLMEFDPKIINITSHRDEYVFKSNEQGYFERKVARKRPGTVAIAAAIKNKYNVTVVPHLVCGGFSQSETEYALFDLNFLGIHDLLLLQGDNKNKDKYPPTVGNQNNYSLDLITQVNNFNKGKLIDNDNIEPFKNSFAYGVAGYPEKHEAAPNFESDLNFLKQKVDAGADYIVTQMFFNNQHYFNFVDRCREIGITVPIIPGIKPINDKSQLTILPQIFKSEIPEDLAKELRKCDTKDKVLDLGVEWALMQSKELMQHNVPVLHFYTLFANNSVKRIAKEIF